MDENSMDEQESFPNALVADAWYGLPHPWYALQQSGPQPSRVIFEYDTPVEDQLPADGYPTLDREVSYQVKFFATHGYWPLGQQSGLPPFSQAEMKLVRTIATMIVTNPQAPISLMTRERLELKGLLN